MMLITHNKYILFGGSIIAVFAAVLVASVEVPFRAAAATPPSAPTVTATASPPNTINLSWTVSTGGTGQIRYGVYRNITGGTAVLLATTTATTYADATASPNVLYYYAILAYDEAGGTATSNLASAMIDTQPPTVPANLSAVLSTSSSVSLSWAASTDNGPGGLGYGVYRNGTPVTTTTALAYTDVNLHPATSYAYTVAAYDTPGNLSAQSASVVVTTPSSQTVFPPSSLTAKSVPPSSVQLTWGASTGGTGQIMYSIYRNLLGGTAAQITSTAATSYTDTNLTQNTSYYYAVLAYDSIGSTSTPSNLASAMIDTQPPTVPANLSAPLVTSNAVSLSWTASTDNFAVAAYQIYRNGTFLASTTALAYTDVNLHPATSYMYTVAAYDTSGNLSLQSAQLLVSTLSTSSGGNVEPENLSVPPAYQNLYSSMAGLVASYEQEAASLAPQNNNQFVFGAELLSANGNTGPALLQPGVINGVGLYLNRLKELGVQGATLPIPYPLLMPTYPSSTDYLNFYKQVAAAVRARNMTLDIESSIIFANSVFSPVTFDYSQLTLNDLEQQRIQMLQTIIDQLHPDYLNIGTEPDTEAMITGKTQLNDPQTWANYISVIANGLQRGTTKIGAGLGTWDPTSFLAPLMATNIDVFTVHSYPLMPPTLDTLNQIIQAAKQNNKLLSLNEVWMNKQTGSEGGSLAADSDVFKRDAWSFWAPLDERFLGAIVRIAKAQGFVYISPFWTTHFFGYLPYDASLDAQPYATVQNAVGQQAAQNLIADIFASTGIYYKDLIASGPSLSLPDIIPPSTFIVSPADSASVSGAITATAFVSDNVGITKVELYADGNLVSTSTSTSSPYAFSLNTTGFTNGPHTFQVKAYDASGNVGTSATISVTVAGSLQSSWAPFNGGLGGGGGSRSASSSTSTSAPSSPTPTAVTPAGSSTIVLFAHDLAYGDTGSDVTLLQQVLTKDNDYRGPVTGYFGILTKAGVKAFQTKEGLPPVGRVGPLTRAALNKLLQPAEGISAPVSASFPRVLSFGAMGPDVILLQQFLHVEGYLPVSPSGFFGALTQHALQAFQCVRGIVCSGTPETTGYGQMGPRTRAEIK